MAHWVWKRRETAKRQNFPFSEETITETVLPELATRHPHEIRVLPFNKSQEAKIGADWEWCFYDHRRSRYVQTLVQAKVLDDSDKDYAHIDRFIGNSRVRQIDRLLSTARHRSVPALYVFYNHLTDINRIPTKGRCNKCVHCWGCSVALGEAVYAELPDKSFKALRRVSQPWTCLLCPSTHASARRSSAPDRVLATLRQLAETSRAEFRQRDRAFDVPPLPDEPSSQPPAYFEQLELIDRFDSPVERDFIINEIAAQNPGVEGLVLITDPLA